MRQRRGYAIPLSLCVAGVTLLLGLSAARLAHGDLTLANQSYHQERARQMAHYGLERFLIKDLPQAVPIPSNSLSQTHAHDSVTIKVFEPGQAGSPVTVPPGHQYWLAEGQARDDHQVLAKVLVGALVRFGHTAGSAGAQLRLMQVQSAQPVLFRTLDGTQEIPDEVICSTEASGLPSPLPSDMIFLKAPVSLNQVADFRGKVRIPKGAPDSVVSSSLPSGALAISNDGGPINLPPIGPPSGLPELGAVTLTSSGALPPGHYTSLRLEGQSWLQLKGAYAIDQLELADNCRVRLQAQSGGSARIFFDQLKQPSSSQLQLQNPSDAAGNFVLFFKKVLPETQSPLRLSLIEGGDIALVAPGRQVVLESDAQGVVKGTFLCDTLQVNYPVNSTAQPQFIYDLSGSMMRMRQKFAEEKSPTQNPKMPQYPGGTDPTETSSGGEGETESLGSNPEDGDTDWPKTTAAGLQATILSRQEF